MQLSDLLCYVFLTTIVAVSCVDAGDQKGVDRKEIRLEKRVGRRGPIVMIESPIDRALQKSKVIYRRVSQSKRFAPQMSQYGVPRSRYRSHKPTKFHRKPGNKLRNHRPKHIASKYLPPTKHKKRSSKPRYELPSKKRPISNFANSFQQPPYPYTAPGSSDFGEPPTNYANNYIPPKKSYGEPPVDSYGAPLKLNNDGTIQTSAPESFQESPKQHENQNYYSYQTYPPWGNNRDNNFANSKKRPSYAKPDFDETFIAPDSQDYNDDFDEVEAYQQKFKDKKYWKKKPLYFGDNTITMNKPWRGNKKPGKNPDIIVGGQYAEPPARYAARFKPSAPMFDDNEDSFVPGFDNNHEIGSSATNSPYVNYKHSNMAFSPQNLNDAFSIVNK